MTTPTAFVVAESACPECGITNAFRRAPLRAQVITCTGCDADLEVVTPTPLTLALAPEVEEDWGE